MYTNRREMGHNMNENIGQPREKYPEGIDHHTFST